MRLSGALSTGPQRAGRLAEGHALLPGLGRCRLSPQLGPLDLVPLSCPTPPRGWGRAAASLSPEALGPARTQELTWPTTFGQSLLVQTPRRMPCRVLGTLVSRTGPLPRGACSPAGSGGRRGRRCRCRCVHGLRHAGGEVQPCAEGSSPGMVRMTPAGEVAFQTEGTARAKAPRTRVWSRALQQGSKSADGAWSRLCAGARCRRAPRDLREGT